MKINTRFVCNNNRINERRKNLSLAQMSVDRDVLRFSEPYVPLDTGMLKKSGTLGTVIGSGRVHYIAPYAKRQYYHGRNPGMSTTGPLCGRYWFERMKAAHLNDIVSAAKKIGGK